MPSVLNERLKGLKVYVIFICLSESIGYPDVNTEKIVIVFSVPPVTYSCSNKKTGTRQ